MTDSLSGHNPVCDHRYPTKACGRSNPAVRSPWDNETSPNPGGRASRERTRRLPASRRSGARMDGMANSGELLINVVRTSKPKALTGLNQNGTWPGAGVSPFPCRRCRATGEQAEPNPSVIRPWNVVSPSSSPWGRPAARWTDGTAGKGRGRKRRPLGNRTDRGYYPARKRADFPRVSPHETVRTTGSGGRADDSSSLLVRPPADPAGQPRTRIVQVGRWPHRVPRGALGEA